jgi:arylsulfatase A-like enzyme
MGLYDNTVIVFLSDHGFLAGEHGRFGKSNRDWKKFIDEDPRYNRSWPYFREVRGSAMMVHVPGLPAARSDALVQAIDIFPTVCDLLGLDKPDTLEGRSMARLLSGDVNTHRDIAVTTSMLSSNLDDKARNVCVSDGNWSLNFTGLEGQTHLFDLVSDPGEAHDLWSEKPEQASALHQAFLREFEPLARDKGIFDTYRELK